MKIDTTYSIKDEVYFFYQNMIRKGKIVHIIINITQYIKEISYYVRPTNESCEYLMHDYQLSTDIDVLLQQLKKRYK